MKTIENKIDRSVKCSARCANAPKRRDFVPLFPISTVEELKAELVKKLSAEYSDVATRLVYQSVNEAYALAALTGEPLLLLPVLAEEKVQNAAAWSVRQQSVLQGAPIAFAA